MHRHAEVAEVTIGWGGELQGTRVQMSTGLVPHVHALVGVLDKLVTGEGGIARLDGRERRAAKRRRRESSHRKYFDK